MTTEDIKNLPDAELMLLAIRANGELVRRGFTPEQLAAFAEIGKATGVADLMEGSMRGHGFIP